MGKREGQVEDGLTEWAKSESKDEQETCLKIKVLSWLIFHCASKLKM